MTERIEKILKELTKPIGMRYISVGVISFVVSVLCAQTKQTHSASEDSLREAVLDEWFEENFTRPAKTPDYETELFPIREVEDTVKCTLSVVLPEKSKAEQPAIIKITCNSQPDIEPSFIVIDNQRTKRWGKTSTTRIDGGVASHQHDYTFRFYPNRTGRFACRSTGLSFHGVPYTGTLFFDACKSPVFLQQEVSSGSTQEKTSFGTLFFSFFFGSVALCWLLMYLYYRRQAREDLASFVLRFRYLPLNTDWATTHFEIPMLILCTSAT